MSVCSSRLAAVLLLAWLGAAGGGCPGTSPDAAADGGEPDRIGAAAAERPAAPAAAESAAEKTDPEAGEASCASCHEEQSRFWAYGGHADVSCEICHRVSGDHIAAKIQPELPGNERCLSCHPLVDGPDAPRLSAAEVFERHLRFVEEKHVIKVDRAKIGNRCIRCHDPHLGQ
ncbi:MAG: hypothetical protein JXQ29_15730 [Planctomycetes bacterium]|nr:hypothetical protein [Planctomycetota bacterium]